MTLEVANSIGAQASSGLIKANSRDSIRGINGLTISDNLQTGDADDELLGESPLNNLLLGVYEDNSP
jgi:hypothetical protein